MNFKKYVIWFIVAAALIMAGRSAVADHQAALRQKVISPGYWEPTIEDLRKAMRYHGIFFARENENHEWYFVRDGKRCRLFAYLKAVKRKP